jgi:hypothetical protein
VEVFATSEHGPATASGANSWHSRFGPEQPDSLGSIDWSPADSAGFSLPATTTAGSPIDFGNLQIAETIDAPAQFGTSSVQLASLDPEGGKTSTPDGGGTAFSRVGLNPRAEDGPVGPEPPSNLGSIGSLPADSAGVFVQATPTVGFLTVFGNRQTVMTVDAPSQGGTSSVLLASLELHNAKTSTLDGVSAASTRTGITSRTGLDAALASSDAVNGNVARFAGLRMDVVRATGLGVYLDPDSMPDFRVASTAPARAGLPATTPALIEDGSTTLAAPPLTGVLQHVSQLEIAAIERGILQFLDHLNPVANDFLSKDGGSRAWPWVAAAAAAVLACELGRRQARRSLAGTEDSHRQRRTLDFLYLP